MVIHLRFVVVVCVVLRLKSGHHLHRVKQFHQLEQSMQAHEPMGSILIHTTSFVSETNRMRI